MPPLVAVLAWFDGEEPQAQAQLAAWAAFILGTSAAPADAPDVRIADLRAWMTLPVERALRARCRVEAFVAMMEGDLVDWLTPEGWNLAAILGDRMAERCADFARMRAEAEAADPDRRARWLSIGERWRAFRASAG